MDSRRPPVLGSLKQRKSYPSRPAMKPTSAALLLALALMGSGALASDSAATPTVPAKPAPVVSSQPMAVPEPIWSSVAAAAAIAFLRRRK